MVASVTCISTWSCAQTSCSIPQHVQSEMRIRETKPTLVLATQVLVVEVLLAAFVSFG